MQPEEWFVICDEKGVETCRLNATDVTKRLPKEFQLKQEKRGTKPRLFLFRNAELDAKRSRWIEDWFSMPLDERHWLFTGQSIIRIRAEKTAFDETIFVNAVPSKRVRAQIFSNLPVETQLAFTKLPVSTQIKLLCVTTRMAKQFENPAFGYPHLLKYVEHILTTKQRRQEEERIRMVVPIPVFRDEEPRELYTSEVGYETEYLYMVDRRPLMFCGVNMKELYLREGVFQDSADARIAHVQRPNIEKRFTQRELRESNDVIRGLCQLVADGRMDWNILVLIYCFYEELYYECRVY